MSLQPARGAGSPIRRPAPHKWFFSKEEMRNTASQKEGMSREEELGFRQMAAAFIQEMVDGLNNVKDTSMRIGHDCICAAHTYMHRFYYWHSFKKFDYRDVGAACVFLAGKSQEFPRKLSHVVSVWRDKKERKQLTTEAARSEATQIIVLLESMVLQTIAFDLNIEFPHTLIVNIMNRVNKDHMFKQLRACAYYFATDVIAVTDWSLRYSAHSMAITIVHLTAAYANVKIEKLFASLIKEHTPWYLPFDPTMNEDKLREMEMDFLTTYRSTSNFHYASKFNFRDNNRHHQQQIENQRRPPTDRSRNSNSPMVSSQEAYRPRGYVPKDELTVEKLNKERQTEEERRKRDYDRMAGRIDHSTSSEKRARIDPLSSNFVTPNNGKHSLAPPPIPPLLAPPTLNSHRSANQRTADSMESSPFRPSARAFDVAPILTPPVQPKMASSADSSDMDLEDGELE